MSNLCSTQTNSGTCKIEEDNHPIVEKIVALPMADDGPWAKVDFLGDIDVALLFKKVSEDAPPSGSVHGMIRSIRSAIFQQG